MFEFKQERIEINLFKYFFSILQPIFLPFILQPVFLLFTLQPISLHPSTSSLIPSSKYAMGDRNSVSEAKLGLLLGVGNIYYYVMVGRGGFPLFFEIFFRNKSAFLRVLSRKKGNFKLLHADLAVFNSKRFFVLVFLQNLYFQQL